MSSHTSLSLLDGFFLRIRLGKWEEGLGGTGYHVACIRGKLPISFCLTIVQTFTVVLVNYKLIFLYPLSSNTLSLLISSEIFMSIYFQAHNSQRILFLLLFEGLNAKFRPSTFPTMIFLRYKCLPFSFNPSPSQT